MQITPPPPSFFPVGTVESFPKRSRHQASRATAGPARRTSAAAHLRRRRSPASPLHNAYGLRRLAGAPTAGLHLLCRRRPPSLLRAAQVMPPVEETAYRSRAPSSRWCASSGRCASSIGALPLAAATHLLAGRVPPPTSVAASASNRSTSTSSRLLCCLCCKVYHSCEVEQWIRKLTSVFN